MGSVRVNDYHHVLAIYEADEDGTDEQLIRWSVIKAPEDTPLEAISARIPSLQPTQFAKIVGGARNNMEAKRLMYSLARTRDKFSPAEIKKDPQSLPPVDPRLPENPRERAIAFRSLNQEDQEEFLYQLITRTGAPKGRLAKWLAVKPEELDHIDLAVIDAAVAELELRIGGNLIHFATGNKSTAAISPVMFLSKALLGWTEAGPNATAPASAVNINFNTADTKDPEIDALRNELGELSKVAAAKANRLQ